MAFNILRLPEVRRKTGLPKSSVYRQVALGNFPSPVRLTPRTTGWLEHEVDQWLETRARVSHATEGR